MAGNMPFPPGQHFLNMVELPISQMWSSSAIATLRRSRRDQDCRWTNSRVPCRTGKRSLLNGFPESGADNPKHATETGSIVRVTTLIPSIAVPHNCASFTIQSIVGLHEDHPATCSTEPTATGNSPGDSTHCVNRRSADVAVSSHARQRSSNACRDILDLPGHSEMD